MAVGHGGDESKHPAWVKIGILEFIRTRFKEIVENDEALRASYIEKINEILTACNIVLTDEQMKDLVDLTIADYYVKVYDPFSTEMDFYIFFNVDWPKYLDLYHKYYEIDDVKSKLQLDAALDKLPSKIKNRYEDLITRAIVQTSGVDEVFNASRSKSVIFYTIEQMKNILECGIPDGCPESDTSDTV